MKTNIVTCLGICIVSLLLSNSIQAQHSANNYDVDQHFVVPNLFITNFDKTAFPNSRRSEFKTKAVADFVRRYLLAENVHWYKLPPKRLVAYFNENGIKNKAFYMNDGSWLYATRTYTEEYLPIEVSSQVKQMFHGFLITSIDEVRNMEQVRYLLHLYDKNSWKNIWFCDGEIEVAEELNILQ